MSSLEKIRDKALLMAPSSTLMTSLVHEVYFFTYLHSFGGLTEAAWCGCALIPLGANSSTLLTQNAISFGQFINQINYYGMIEPQSSY